MNKKLIIGIEFANLALFKEAIEIAGLQHYKISEDVTHRMLRKRGSEVLACREMGIPYFAYMKPQTNSEHENSQFSIIEANFDVDSINKADFALVVRKDSFKYPDNLGFEYFIDKEVAEKISLWPNLFSKDEIGRDIKICSQVEILKALRAKELTLPFSLKSLNKNDKCNFLDCVFNENNIHTLIPTSERPDLDVENLPLSSYLSTSDDSLLTRYVEPASFNNAFIGKEIVVNAAYISLVGDLIKSDVLTIKEDLRSHPKKIHRAFIVDGIVVSISRYFEYDSYISPQSVLDYASEFAEKFKDRLPAIYVADFAETEDGVKIMDISGYENSIGYLMNDSKSFFGAIMQKSVGDSPKIISDGLFTPAVDIKYLPGVLYFFKDK